METVLKSIPGYRVNEYLLVLTPHEELKNRIKKISQDFNEKYKTEILFYTNPQIVLASFTQHAMMEERLVNRLKLVAMAQTPFKVDLKDFGSFPSHTIYINVLSKPAIHSIVRQIRSDSQKLMKLNEENKPYFITEPHLTIARKLKPWQYEKGWLEYSHKNFSGRFIADSMSLLRRSEGEPRYQLMQRFAFENMPVSIKQGELFA